MLVFRAFSGTMAAQHRTSVSPAVISAHELLSRCTHALSL